MAVAKPLVSSEGTLSKWPAFRSASRSLVCPPYPLSHTSLKSRFLLSGICDRISDQLLDSPVSGLMGLAWQSLSSSGATPFWQSLFEGNVWDQPLMAFYLTRFLNVSNANAQEPGGVFTMGLSNCSAANFPCLSCTHHRLDQYLAVYG